MNEKYASDYPDHAPIHLPLTHGERGPCLVRASRGYVCTRPTGHGGRHVAMSVNLAVCAVWGDR